MQDYFYLVIAGSRTFHDYDLMKKEVRSFILRLKPLQGDKKYCIVSGGANGADALGERLARDYGQKLLVMKADWNKDGRAAGFRRNERMAEIADAVIVFQVDGSKGSAHMIEQGLENKLPVKVVAINATLTHVEHHNTP